MNILDQYTNNMVLGQSQHFYNQPATHHGPKYALNHQQSLQHQVIKHQPKNNFKLLNSEFILIFIYAYGFSKSIIFRTTRHIE